MAIKFNFGDKLRIIDAGDGAKGADGRVGIVTSERSNSGLYERDNGFNIRLENGIVWRVSESGNYEVIQHNRGLVPTSNVHKYKHESYALNTTVTDGNGFVIDQQHITKPEKNYKVIYNGKATIVILEDGTKGIAKCSPEDKFSVQMGHDIAIIRANIKKLQKDLRNLTK